MTKTAADCSVIRNSDTMSLLVTLPPELLMKILIQTPASTHEALRNTCRIFRDTINSQDFRVRRSLERCSEVAVDLSPFQEAPELHEEDMELLGIDREHLENRLKPVQNLNATIRVDGHVAGSARVTLIPRSLGGNFYREVHEIIEIHSGVAKAFFDRAGFPKLSCLKECGDDDAENGIGGLAYISTFQVNGHSTHEGSEAIRRLLCATALHGEWTTAIYVADAHAHFTDEDREEEAARKERAIDEGYRSMVGKETETDEERNLADKEWSNKFDRLAKYDIRQFLRAGFQQASELVGERAGYHVYAIPSFIEEPRRLSHEEALNLPIVELPTFPDRPTGVNEKLLKVFDRSCMASYGLEYASEKPVIMNETRDQLVQLLHSGASVEKSHALHCCASFLQVDLFCLLFEFAENPTESINALDSRGRTPLMCATSSDPMMALHFRDRHRRVLETCSKLIDLGADKNVINHRGMSALGYLRESLTQKDLRIIWGDEENSVKRGYEQLDRLLHPFPEATEQDDNVHEELLHDFLYLKVLGGEGDSDGDFDY